MECQGSGYSSVGLAIIRFAADPRRLPAGSQGKGNVCGQAFRPAPQRRPQRIGPPHPTRRPVRERNVAIDDLDRPETSQRLGMCRLAGHTADHHCEEPVLPARLRSAGSQRNVAPLIALQGDLRPYEADRLQPQLPSQQGQQRDRHDDLGKMRDLAAVLAGQPQILAAQRQSRHVARPDRLGRSQPDRQVRKRARQFRPDMAGGEFGIDRPEIEAPDDRPRCDDDERDDNRKALDDNADRLANHRTGVLIRERRE
ncbi:MAG: hypothetical protein F4092_01210 [Rhodospirillaceae bacterium]|nr:hypothetical protein [Rhodospirillaceae bacterium]